MFECLPTSDVHEVVRRDLVAVRDRRRGDLVRVKVRVGRRAQGEESHDEESHGAENRVVVETMTGHIAPGTGATFVESAPIRGVHRDAVTMNGTGANVRRAVPATVFGEGPVAAQDHLLGDPMGIVGARR